MLKTLFIDIEGTLVDDWFNFNVLQENVDAIKSFIKKNNFDRVAFFTYAFWSVAELKPNDVNKIKELSYLLEIQYLKYLPQLVYTKQSIIELHTPDVISKYSLENELAFNEKFRTKQEAFIALTRGMQDECGARNRQEVDATLIDDTNEEVVRVEFPKKMLKIIFGTLNSIKFNQRVWKDD